MKHKLSEVIEFGEKLITTGDLDPVYIALYKSGIPYDQMCRLFLTYFCFYHLGVSAYISEYGGSEFWDVLDQAAENQMPPSGTDSDISFDRWPRGSERRHFRGDKCVDAVKELRRLSDNDPKRRGPEMIVKQLSGTNAKLSLEQVMLQVRSFPMFGPWISFKVADMLERVLAVPVTFPNDLTLFYDEPRKALDMLELPAEEANERLLKHFARFPAPPGEDRPCGIAEVETCLCKVKSFWNKTYRVGKDIHEVRRALKGWGKTAGRLLAKMPPEVEQGLFG